MNGTDTGARLREDIRFLGRVLGETIGEQSGADALALIESIPALRCASGASRMGNMDMVLAKTDITIAARYAALVTDSALRGHVFRRIEDEFRRARQALLAITGQRDFLEHNPPLARGIRDRLPYLDPLNHLQLELLHRYRGGGADEIIKRALHMTINGIAAALRNSG